MLSNSNDSKLSQKQINENERNYIAWVEKILETLKTASIVTSTNEAEFLNAIKRCTDLVALDYAFYILKITKEALTLENVNLLLRHNKSAESIAKILRIFKLIHIPQQIHELFLKNIKYADHFAEKLKPFFEEPKKLSTDYVQHILQSSEEEIEIKSLASSSYNIVDQTVSDPLGQKVDSMLALISGNVVLKSYKNIHVVDTKNKLKPINSIKCEYDDRISLFSDNLLAIYSNPSTFESSNTKIIDIDNSSPVFTLPSFCKALHLSDQYAIGILNRDHPQFGAFSILYILNFNLNKPSTTKVIEFDCAITQVKRSENYIFMLSEKEIFVYQWLNNTANQMNSIII